jgi:carboxymethylenebutenolidase
VDTTFEYYEDAGHAFANDHDRLGTYHEGHAKAAWDKTLGFLKQKLGKS